MSTHTHNGTCGCHAVGQDAKPSGESLEHLRQVVAHAVLLLPAQGPIGVFVHYNTLHALQYKVFEDAVVEGAKLFDAEPFLSEEAYQAERSRQRILDEDIDDILNREPDTEILPGKLTRRQLRRVMLTPGVRRVNGVNISWQLEEGDWLRSFRRDLPGDTRSKLHKDKPRALWDVCLARVKPQPAPLAARSKRPREAVMAQFGIDMDQIIHPPLIRLVEAYLDQGIAYWPMPLREEGLLKAARKIMPQVFAIFPAHLSGVYAAFLRQESGGMDAEAVVQDALKQLAVPAAQWEEYLTEELLALRGWAGMIRMLENDVTLAPHDRIRCSIMEFLALRLTYTVAALQDIAADTTAWRAVRLPPSRFDHSCRTYVRCRPTSGHQQQRVPSADG